MAGLREFGAPDLADGIWLYGGPATLTRRSSIAVRGVIPRWNKNSTATIKMLAAYVYSLGGGEATPAAAVPAAAPQRWRQAANGQP
jgi:cytochrome c oxidase cbb3-type subunit 3